MEKSTDEEKPVNPARWLLPPLIIHPFTEEQATEQLLAGSRAMLAMHGLSPGDSSDDSDLELQVRRGRVQEMRMLYFLGKDLLRWMDQCTDFVNREPSLRESGIRQQSFAALLVESTPASVAQKMTLWGVTDHKSVFSRAIALTSCCGTPPSLEVLAHKFVDHYHRFADYLFVCCQTLTPYLPALSDRFDFQLYASAEYASMLEQQFLNTQ